MDEGDEFTLETPALDHIIERPRLIEKIEEAGARVTLFCAPAGYGKTTLARQWSDRQERRAAWYRTTHASGDVAALAVGLDTLLAGTAPPRDRDPRRIASIASVNPSPAPLGRALVSTYRRLPEAFLLVVDEYEAAKTEEADELFGLLVDGLPIRFLFTSRDRPTWFEPKLSVYGEAFELGIDDLTMDDEEARAVLERGGASTLDPMLLERARGWPAVLGMAAMANGHALPDEKLLPRALYDYLASELVEAAPQEVQDGLLLLAAASVGSVEVARLLLGRASKRILEEAAKRRLVILGAEGELALHPLLRELLLIELRDTEEPETLAAQLTPLIAARRWDEALAAAELLRVREFVEDALTASLDDLLHEGRTATLRRWAAVGKASGASPPLVEYIESELALRSAEFDRALLLAARAAGKLGAQRAAQAHLCASRAAHLGERRTRAITHAKLAEQLASDHRTRMGAVWSRLIHAADTESSELNGLFAHFLTIADDSDESHLRLALGRIHVALLGGGLREALDEADLASTLTGNGADPFVETAFLSGYCELLAILARYSDAVAAADACISLASEYGLTFVDPFIRSQKAKALIGFRRFAHGDRELLAVQRIVKGSPNPYCTAHVALHRASLYLSIGDFERAEDVLRVDLHAEANPTQRGERQGLLALTYAASRQFAAAVEAANRARALSSSSETRVLSSLAEAIVSLEQSDSNNALRSALEARELEALHELILALRASPALADLLAAQDNWRDFLTQLFIKSNDAAIARKVGLTIPRSARRTDLLSPRELEIHGLIAHGLTNREIATLLFISTSTTKIHVRHVLEKLGVRSRIEAARLWQPPDEGTSP